METKVCNKCGRELPIDDFYLKKNRHGNYHHEARCKECHKEASRKFREEHKEAYAQYERERATTDKRKQQRRDAVYRYNEKNPEKHRAHNAVSKAVSRGKINKPQTCENCGAEERLEAHHWHGYDKEHWLDVIWLCYKCHRKEHD